MNDPHKITGERLLRYLDQEVEAKRLHPGTASSRRSGVRDVLNVNFGPDDWEDTEFSADDVPALLEKFVIERTGAFNENTITSYRSYFSRAVETYVEASDDQSAPTDDELISYRTQIRPGMVIELPLPADFTAAEAKRLARFIESLPLDEQ